MSELEEALALQLRAAGIQYEREVRLIPGRRLSWDFVVDDLAIEVQGGVWVPSGHSSGRGITRDCEKLNLATMAGYRPLAFTREMIESGEALRMIELVRKDEGPCCGH